MDAWARGAIVTVAPEGHPVKHGRDLVLRSGRRADAEGCGLPSRDGGGTRREQGEAIGCAE